ncbi:hypothetical protein CCACVL1_23514 [Corchorus capsularis]|uniref:Uncharacterized protein n=1 Tax=Corchorus capsularis TaxID=210143 RepID=A0A1R3GTW7_COCAP|nr:hypothetical protein CCACVL1_23514 [Corchorus capsularis]
MASLLPLSDFSSPIVLKFSPSSPSFKTHFNVNRPFLYSSFSYPILHRSALFKFQPSQTLSYGGKNE